MMTFQQLTWTFQFREDGFIHPAAIHAIFDALTDLYTRRPDRAALSFNKMFPQAPPTVAHIVLSGRATLTHLIDANVVHATFVTTREPAA